MYPSAHVQARELPYTSTLDISGALLLLLPVPSLMAPQIHAAAIIMPTLKDGEDLYCIISGSKVERKISLRKVNRLRVDQVFHTAVRWTGTAFSPQPR